MSKAIDDIQDKLDKMRGSTLTLRIQSVSITALLVRTSASDSDIAGEFAFEDANPKNFSRFYYHVRRNIGSRVSISMGGVNFEAVIGDTTKLPANFQPEAYVNDMFTITFEFPKKQAKAQTIASAYICIPTPSIKKLWKSPPEYPHLTIGYIPEITHAQAEDVAWMVHSIVSQFEPFSVTTSGREVFGTKNVALVRMTPTLRALHIAIVQKVNYTYPNLIDLKTHPKWRPHITIGESDQVVSFNTDVSLIVDTVNVNVKDGAEYELNMRKV